MKTISNTLKAIWDRWEDPGDYPNSLASGPLPPGPWRVSEIEGEVVVELTLDELSQAFSVGFAEFVSSETDGIDMPDGVLSCVWQLDEIVHLAPGYLLTLSCREFEPDHSYCGPEPPDHKEFLK